MSVSTTGRSIASNMSSGEDSIRESGGEGGLELREDVVATGMASATNADVLRAIAELGSDIKDLKHTVKAQNKRIKKLEGDITEDNDSDTDHNSKGAKSKKVKCKGGVRSKKKDIDFEKQRQLKLAQEKCKNKHGTSRSDTEEESTDDEIDLRGIKKKMSSSEKGKCEKQLTSRVKAAGGVFPDEDDDDTSSSGNSSSDSGHCSRRRKIKSGAKVKKRPVVRQELGHTRSRTKMTFMK